MRKYRGFTLVELMIVLLLLAVVATIGVPSFAQLMRSNQLTSHANGVLSALQLARSEAAARGVPVAVCGSNNGSSCTNNGWGSGWIVFRNPAGNGTLANPQDIIRTGSGADTLAGTGNFVLFTAAGARGAGSAVAIRLSRTSCGVERARQILISPGGRTYIEEVDC